MLPSPINPNVLQLALLDAQAEDELEREAEIVKARNYHEGDHPTFLTDRLKEFLNIDDDETAFRMNICRIVISAVVERLVVKGIDCADPKSKEFAAAVWRANRLDLLSTDEHEMALCDAEAFAVVDWDAARPGPRVLPHPRYTDISVDGDGYGCMAIYQNDDVNLPMQYAIKRWTEDLGQGKTRLRATFYYPDRIEKFVFGAGGWKAIADEGDTAWPIPWLDRAGKPLGIAVVHFQNRSLRPEALDAWPLQDALNKSLIDLIASADLTAFRIFVALGFIPTTDGEALADDGSNALKIAPAQIVGTTRTAQEASFTAIEPADLTQLRNLLQDLIMHTATVTDTPTSRFKISAQVAAEGTLKQQDEPLLAKIDKRQILFGEAWAQVLTLSRRLANTFGGAGLAEDAAYTIQWGDAAKRTDSEQQAEWKAKKELGIPRRQIWSEMGYSPEKIQEMLDDPETKALTFAQFP